VPGAVIPKKPETMKHLLSVAAAPFFHRRALPAQELKARPRSGARGYVAALEGQGTASVPLPAVRSSRAEVVSRCRQHDKFLS
jgi:hypothetical protein